MPPDPRRCHPHQPELHTLVLLGDILDLVRSDHWHRSAIPMAQRPWGGTLDPRTGMNADRATVEPQFQAVLGAVLATPTAGALRTMLASLTTGPTPVRATYVIGNHERVMWNFPSLRETARASLPQIAGFAAAVDAPEYGILARHGHEWDEHTHRARHDYFSATPDGMVRMYVNTGAFLPLITRARDGRTFARAQQMTMVFAYREDEDTQGKRVGTTSVDIWNGTRRKLYG